MEPQSEVTPESIAETKAALKEKLEVLEDRVVATVQGAAGAVTDTVQSVKDVVSETVDNIRDTFDIRYQAQRHPWRMMACGAAIGFTGGWLLQRALEDRQQRPVSSSWPVPSTVATTPSAPEQVSSTQNGKGWLSSLTEPLEDQVGLIKSVAVASVLGLIRQMLPKGDATGIGARVGDFLDQIGSNLVRSSHSGGWDQQEDRAEPSGDGSEVQGHSRLPKTDDRSQKPRDRRSQAPNGR